MPSGEYCISFWTVSRRKKSDRRFLILRDQLEALESRQSIINGWYAVIHDLCARQNRTGGSIMSKRSRKPWIAEDTFGNRIVTGRTRKECEDECRRTGYHPEKQAWALSLCFAGNQSFLLNSRAYRGYTEYDRMVLS